MIIPEVVNSNLNEKKLLNIFLNLFNDKKKQETQINSINMYLKEIVNDFSPYDAVSYTHLTLPTKRIV